MKNKIRKTRLILTESGPLWFRIRLIYRKSDESWRKVTRDGLIWVYDPSLLKTSTSWILVLTVVTNNEQVSVSPNAWFFGIITDFFLT